jgi:ferric-dicitrate binding protein FerR (iron transport regulator)
MPATLLHIDRDQLAALRIGDERALERIFRDTYAALVEEAKPQLDDASGAPRVVEGAFKRVWAERATFETPEALETFLHEEVHDCAVRERKRLATLHRFEAGAHVHATPHRTSLPTVDEAWNHLADSLHVMPVDAATAARQHAELVRHDAATHVAPIAQRRIPWGVIAIGVVVAAIVIAPLWWMSQRSTDAAISRALASSDVRLVSTLPGQQAGVTLLDGSKVTLGADSKLVIAPDFGGTVRGLKLEGTGLFTVAPGNKHEFQVRAGNASATATGTTFAVRAYPSDNAVTVSVREGTVRVKASGETRDVAAGHALVVAKNGAMREPSAGELEAALGWTNGNLVIAERPLRDALTEMARWYAYDIKVRDSTLLNRPVSVKAGLQSPRDAIAALERSGRLKFDYEAGNVMVLRDAATAAPQRAAVAKKR